MLSRAANLGVGPVAGALTLALVVACGGPPPATAPTAATAPPPLVVTARSGDDLRRVTDAAPLFGGPALRAWMAAPLRPDGAELAFADDAPRRTAWVDDLGTEVRAGRLAAPDALAAQLATAWPGAEHRFADGGALWIGSDAVVARHGAWAYLVSGGAASSRLRAAVELADDGGLDGPADDADLALTIDGALLVTFFAGRAAGAPALIELGADLGPVTLRLDVADDAVDWSVTARPEPGSLAEDLVRRPAVGASDLAPSPVAIGAALDPAQLATLLPAIAQPLEVNLSRVASDLEAQLAGDVFLGVGAVSVTTREFVTLRLEAGARDQLDVLGLQVGENSVVVGGPSSIGVARAGVTLLPAYLLPALPPAPPPLPMPLTDDNPDVPWSREYRRARDRAQEAHEEAADRVKALGDKLTFLARQRVLAVGASHGTFAATEGAWRARGSWLPAEGLAALQDRLTATAARELRLPTEDHARAVAARAEAIAEMVHVRAADVAAFDRTARP
ncbi:MAG: hypothetical protein R2939_15035 [Kofleriaceae bacterium]